MVDERHCISKEQYFESVPFCAEMLFSENEANFQFLYTFKQFDFLLQRVQCLIIPVS